MPLVAVVAALLTACVPSLNPLYTDADLTVDDALTGLWYDSDGASWYFERSDGPSYRLTYSPKLAGVPLQERPGRPGHFVAHLVRLGNDLFLDLYPDSYPDGPDLGNDLLAFHLVPAHTFSRIWIERDSLRLGMMDPDWLDAALDSGEIELAHKRGDEGILLTASTAELQAFARSFAEHPEAFGAEVQLLRSVAAALGETAAPIAAPARGELPPELAGEIDAAAAEVLEETRVPSASIAVLRDGAIVLNKAYGRSRIDPDTAATPQMRYPIGSISKQFTATAVVMLAEEGKLDLDEPIARFFPEVTRADVITLRQLLSHTSGMRDYWPQDYVPPAMLEPITTEEVIGRFATQPLDFEPGSQYQYSNTGFVLAGAIVEKVAGEPLMELLERRIFEPLGMTSVFDIDTGPLPSEDPAGYQRFALGPLRRAPKEAPGWLFGTGQLAMTAEDLSKWNHWLMTDGGLGAAVLDTIAREEPLTSGVGSGYGLGIGVALDDGRRRLRHGGEVSGFTARSVLYPDDDLAVVVLANQDANRATATLSEKVVEVLFEGGGSGDAEMLERVSAVLDGLHEGSIERTWFTDNGNAYFSETALADIAASLDEMGSRQSIEQKSRSLRGGFITRVFQATYEGKTLEIVTRATADGQLEQLTLSVE